MRMFSWLSLRIALFAVLIYVALVPHILLNAGLSAHETLWLRSAAAAMSFVFCVIYLTDKSHFAWKVVTFIGVLCVLDIWLNKNNNTEIIAFVLAIWIGFYIIWIILKLWRRVSSPDAISRTIGNMINTLPLIAVVELTLISFHSPDGFIGEPFIPLIGFSFFFITLSLRSGQSVSKEQ